MYVVNVFNSSGYTNCFPHGTTDDIVADLAKEIVYMEIPLNENRIEVPVFALSTFRTLEKINNTSSKLVVSLYSKGETSKYKSFNKIMETVLNESFAASRLVRLEGKDGDKTTVYYATSGAIFNDNFQPLMMSSWILEKEPVDSNMDINILYHWSFDKLILRIDPEFYLSKPDNVGRYIMKKIIPTILGRAYFPPDYHDTFYGCSSSHLPSLVVEKCPFLTRHISRPSISTTNKVLAETVVDNIEDFT